MGKNHHRFSVREFLVPVLFFLLLAAISLLQYDWFRRSAEAEVSWARASLSDKLTHQVIQVFQRYQGWVGELRNLSMDSPQVRSYMESQMLRFTGEKSLVGIVQKMGYFDPDSDQGWFLSPGGTWTQEKLPPRTERAKGFPDPRGWADHGDFPHQTLVFYNGRHVGLLFELNVQELFNRLIAPTLARDLPGYQFKMEASDGPSSFVRSGTFNPIQSLWGAENRSLYIPLPPLMGGGREPGGFPQPPLFGDHPPDKPDQSLGNFSPGDRGKQGLLHVIPPGDSLIFTVERKMAWLWLFATILQVLIALAFIYVYKQGFKLKNLAKRERELMAGVTHELRTPLTVIQAAADNLVRGIVGSDRIPVYGQTIQDQALRLGKMVEEMILIAQVEARSSKNVNWVDFTLEDIEGELFDPLSMVAKEKKQELSWKTVASPLYVSRGDREGVELVVKNLVMNALIHAYPGKGGQIRVKLELVPQGKKTAFYLTVEDDGRGIAPKDQKDVFEPFFRDEVSRNRQEFGSGLGLFLVSKKVQSMGGTLKLESPYKRENGMRRSGCRFTIKLPIYGKEKGK